jgi:hypothetical protein
MGGEEFKDYTYSITDVSGEVVKEGDFRARNEEELRRSLLTTYRPEFGNMIDVNIRPRAAKKELTVKSDNKMARPTKKKNTGSGISLLPRPSADVLKKARKMGKLRATPKKSGIKTEAQAKAFETRWNDWVKYVKDKAKAADEKAAKAEKLKKAKAAISGL